MTLSLVLVFLGSLGLDQITKEHAHRSLLVWQDEQNDELFHGSKINLLEWGDRNQARQATVPLYFGFNLQYSRNKGAAFSMLSDLDERYRVPLFYAITLMAVVLISFYLRSTPLHHRFTRYGLIMILSGAIGNFLDRLHRGYVVDFLDAEWNLLGWEHDFAIFNVADVAINIGVICLAIDMILHRHENSKKKDEEKDPHTLDRSEGLS